MLCVYAYTEPVTSKSQHNLKVNVAQYMKTLQSSTSSSIYGSEKAVDVNMNTCSYTRSTLDAWWQVDLHGTYEIKTVVISTPAIRGEAKYQNKATIAIYLYVLTELNRRNIF